MNTKIAELVEQTTYLLAQREPEQPTVRLTMTELEQVLVGVLRVAGTPVTGLQRAIQAVAAVDTTTYMQCVWGLIDLGVLTLTPDRKIALGPTELEPPQ